MEMDSRERSGATDERTSGRRGGGWCADGALSKRGRRAAYPGRTSFVEKAGVVRGDECEGVVGLEMRCGPISRAAKRSRA